MPAEILAALIAILAGLAGYAFREYSNKVQPFFQILGIEEFTQNSDDVSVDPNLKGILENTLILPELSANAKFRDIYELWYTADDIRKFWPDVKQAVNKVLSSQSEYELIDALASLFRLTYFQSWIILLLIQDRIEFINLPQNLDEKINVFEDDDADGSVWITFPQKASQFGRSFNTPIIRAKCNLFLDSIKYLHRPSIDKAILSFREACEKEYNMANQIFHYLEDIIHEHSRWGFYTYVANLNNYPMVIDIYSKILIQDKKTGNFSEDCNLVLISETENGELSLERRARMPFVLQGGSSALLGFLTKNTQGEMRFGKAIREAFERRQASCQVEIHLRKIGLIKKQLYKSQISSFSETNL